MEAGFPCTPYSTEGLKLGRRDPRSFVFDKVVDKIEKKKPKLVILENVKALATHKRHWQFWNFVQTRLRSCCQRSYNVQFKILNSKDYKLPQVRRRLYIVMTWKKGEVKKFEWP